MSWTFHDSLISSDTQPASCTTVQSTRVRYSPECSTFSKNTADLNEDQKKCPERKMP